MNGALLTAQADRFDLQVGQAPSSGPIKQGIHPSFRWGSHAPWPVQRDASPSAGARHKAARRGQGFPGDGQVGR
jgi:hypothetical protein